jgi:hypothetical protein
LRRPADTYVVIGVAVDVQMLFGGESNRHQTNDAGIGIEPASLRRALCASCALGRHDGERFVVSGVERLRASSRAGPTRGPNNNKRSGAQEIPGFLLNS